MARVLIVDDESKTHDVLEVVEVGDKVVRARTPYRFEIGEELRLRIEGDKPREVTTRVRAHDSDRITEFEIVT